MTAETCSWCLGSGHFKLAGLPCNPCRGTGKQQSEPLLADRPRTQGDPTMPIDEDPAPETDAPKPKKRSGPLSFDAKLRALRDAKLAAVLKLAARELAKRQEHAEVQQQLAAAQSELARAERALAEQPELPVAAQ